MTLKNRIQEDMKSAMRAKETERLGTIRLILSAIKQKEVDERVELSDTDVLAILNKMIKQRRESATQFRNGDRVDLAEKEEKEIIQLSEYLPQQFTDEEVDTLIESAIQQTGAVMQKEMGLVMNIIRPKAQGRTDMAKVSEKIKSKLK
ncbi:MAG: GatB/YqeY domain-containing protein [Coxiellaceae bacterium]|nr:GatB/YqeY domain-containing protein [Coxiellaceae bacterium]